MKPLPSKPRLRIRVMFDDAGMLGPGKADLLDGIAETGSIAAAGRLMGMSYKRAWQLVSTMNEMFEHPVVTRTRGGAQGGGAQVTDTGHQVLAAYRALQQAADTAAQPHRREIESLLKPMRSNGAPPE